MWVWASRGSNTGLPVPQCVGLALVHYHHAGSGTPDGMLAYSLQGADAGQLWAFRQLTLVQPRTKSWPPESRAAPPSPAPRPISSHPPPTG
ncbi:hypothetical protein AAFF_G00285190 [Aldrovandia affinis]|uniref:Uncharacterized protein n=1 Tax=Aldrovandia affinis TaxID=143900 RepID=A0AAD7TAX6_9TELE|nr:hypothetical protein AAFF_G00285190 [Aldrovandia affinis]